LVANMDENLDVSCKSDKNATRAYGKHHHKNKTNPYCITTHEKLDEILGLLRARKMPETKGSNICKSDTSQNCETNDALTAENISPKCKSGRRARNRSDGQTILYDLERLASAQAAWKAPGICDLTQDATISKENNVLPTTTGDAASELQNVRAKTHDLRIKNGNAKSFIGSTYVSEIDSEDDQMEECDISFIHNRQLQHKYKMYEKQPRHAIKKKGIKAEDELCCIQVAGEVSRPKAWQGKKISNVQVFACTGVESAFLGVMVTCCVVYPKSPQPRSVIKFYVDAFIS
jgi:hypothetical protein